MAMNMWGNNGYTGNQPQQPTPPNSMITFISDDSMAVNYPVSPGTTVALINANDPANGKMYIKSTEPNGMPNPMRVFALQEITPQKQGENTVSRQEFENIAKQMQTMQENIQQLIASLQAPKKTGGTAKG
jgi:hypothetical protein